MAELLRAARDVGPTASQKAALAAHLGVAGHASWWGLAAKGLAVVAVAGGGALGVAAGLSSSQQAEQASLPGLVSTPRNGADSEADASSPPDSLESQLSKARPSAEAPPSAGVARDSLVVGSARVDQDELAGKASEPTGSRSELRPRSQEAGKKTLAASAGPSEAQLLSAARAAIGERADRALRLLDDHERLYPRGVLAQEREVLRVRALKAAGDDAAASARAREFREAHPDSVHSTE